MSQADLRADSLAAAFAAFGVAVEVLSPSRGSLMGTITGVWVQPVTEVNLGGFNVQRSSPSRILAVRRKEAPKMRRGYRLRTGDGVGGPVRNFRVDGFAEIFDDHYRLALVPDDSIPVDPVPEDPAEDTDGA